MKKLTKEEAAQRGKLVEDLRAASAKVEDEIAAFNAKREELAKPMNDAIAAFNKIAEDAEGFVSDIVSSMDDYASEKSDKWQESDTGQAFEEWKSAWEGIACEAFDDVSIEEVEMPDTDMIDDLENAPEEVS